MAHPRCSPKSHEAYVPQTCARLHVQAAGAQQLLQTQFKLQPECRRGLRRLGVEAARA